MRDDVKRDMGWANEAFMTTVLPRVRGYLQPGEVISIEGSADKSLYNMLDCFAGIDAVQIVATPKGKMARGLASRVQWAELKWSSNAQDFVPRGYSTFTIRYRRDSGSDTEYAKRCAALDEPEKHWLAPALTIQAYIARGTSHFVEAAVMRTRDLFSFVRSHEAAALDAFKAKKSAAGLPVFMNRCGNATFLCVRWDAIAGAGFDIGVAREPDEARAA